MIYYLDASAWVKRYYIESGTDWIEKLFVEGSLLACSTLGMVEVVGVLARKHKAKVINSRQINDIYLEIEKDWTHFIQVKVTEQIAESAKEIAKLHAIRGSDAIHLSSMKLLGERLSENENNLIIVVSDREMKAAAISMGFEVLDPENLHNIQ